ncbi:MAG: PEP-CTERM sorting domain-containing protein [Nostoc sp. NMS1]|uniref:PEP-CTERM sorting domain-containing protein n=1 Tax=unclassified Nostoc TaxID=2593658 RepID=UPI0025E1EDB2|nr:MULTISPECIES: PEP-CTERM sorting domain-containing protein [unclassified Nostoc]MBN3910336.1 PEP-CTERM sorting domain-containing protein [Nostoc sp. NMS1]MBN3989970.1 PEP-CTERM sorting domain-containing protein [Nostoc sp. NMS2]
MKLVPQLVLAASLVLGLATIDAKSASAAIVNYAFTVDSSVSTGKGFFSFDDSNFSNDGISEALVQSLSFQFDGDSSIYTEKDDFNYPDFPIAFSTAFLTEEASSVGLDYAFADKANPSSSKSYEIVGEDFTIFSRTSPNTELFSGKVSYTKVPEPTTLGGTLVACGLGLIILNRKATSIKKVKV